MLFPFLEVLKISGGGEPMVIKSNQRGGKWPVGVPWRLAFGMGLRNQCCQHLNVSVIYWFVERLRVLFFGPRKLVSRPSAEVGSVDMRGIMASPPYDLVWTDGKWYDGWLDLTTIWHLFFEGIHLVFLILYSVILFFLKHTRSNSTSHVTSMKYRCIEICAY